MYFQNFIIFLLSPIEVLQPSKCLYQFYFLILYHSFLLRHINHPEVLVFKRIGIQRAVIDRQFDIPFKYKLHLYLSHSKIIWLALNKLFCLAAVTENSFKLPGSPLTLQ